MEKGRLIRRIPLQVSFSLDLCLDSGQAFGWQCHHGIWIGSVRHLGLALCQTPSGLEWKSSDPKNAESVIRDYLALDDDPNVIVSHFPKDPFLNDAIRFCKGLRILRQDPWECLAGFILSSSKRIVHIRQIWRTVSNLWGPELSFPKNYHAFPGPSILAKRTEKELRSCGIGFRAPYLLAAARAVDSGTLRLDKLKTMSTVEARKELLTLRGVGEKIADCVLLFSLGKADAFPVDTWIFKALNRAYFQNRRNISISKIRSFASVHFGSYGGHAQQYLFHYIRMNPHLTFNSRKLV